MTEKEIEEKRKTPLDLCHSHGRAHKSYDWNPNGLHWPATDDQEAAYLAGYYGRPVPTGSEAVTRTQVIDLMKSSKSQEEWDANVEKVRKMVSDGLIPGRVCPGYEWHGLPEYWFKAISYSGLHHHTSKTWGHR